MRNILLVLMTISSIYSGYGQNFQAKDLLFFPGTLNSHEQFHMDNEGNYFIAGIGTGAIDLDFGPSTNTLSANSVKDLYIAKYNSDNSFQWATSFESTGEFDRIRAIVSDDMGNIYVAGTYSGTIQLTSDGQHEYTTTSYASMFVTKLDSGGLVQWSFDVGEDASSQIPKFMNISEGRLLIQLAYEGSFDVDPGPETFIIDDDSNAMLVYNLEGELVEAFTHRGDTKIESSIMDSEGNVYLAGRYSGLVSLDYKTNASIFPLGAFDAFIAKYDKDLNLIWYKRIGKSSTNNSFYHLTFDNNEDILMAALIRPGVTVGEYETQNNANHLVHITKEGEYTNVLEALPEWSDITAMGYLNNNQIYLSGNFVLTIDLDFSENIHEFTAFESTNNRYFATYDTDFNFIEADYMHASSSNTHSVINRNTDEVYILTDFEGEGKIAFGSIDTLVVEEEENFVFYKLDVDGCSTSFGDLELEACDEIIINDQLYTESGSYEEVIMNTEGCDSILSITLSIFPSIEYDTMILSCGPYTINGIVLGESGAYSFPYSTVNGCDSTLFLTLEVIDIDAGVLIDGNEISASEDEGDQYQWYDCSTDMAIEGAISQNYMPSGDGSYRVQIFKDACSFFTECIDFVLTGTSEINLDFTISPNPVSDVLYVEGLTDLSKSTYSFFDLTGKMVDKYKRLQPNSTIDVSNLDSGIYILKIKNQHQLTLKKVIKH